MTECWWVVGSLFVFNWSRGNLGLSDREEDEEEEEENGNHSTILLDKSNLRASDKQNQKNTWAGVEKKK